MGYIGRYTAPSIVDLESPVSVDGTTIIENGVLKNVGIDGIKLKSSGDSITKSDGTTAVLSESSGTVTVDADVSTIGNATISGGNISGTEIDLKSSGTTIFASDGVTAVLNESDGFVRLNNAIIDSNNTFPNGSIIQTAAKQMRNGSSYWTGTISSNTYADPNALGGLKCVFTRDFTSGSTIVWQLLVSPGNGVANTYGTDIRLKPFYRNTSNNWAAIDSVVWPTDGLNLLSCCLPSSSIGSLKEVGFGVIYHSGSGTISIARHYSFCMVLGFEIKFDTDPLA